VDEKGNTVIDRFKSDGQEILFDDPEKLKTYLGFGYHTIRRARTSRKLEEDLKAKERQIEETMPMLEQFLAAQREGRLRVINPGDTEAPEKGPRPARKRMTRPSPTRHC